LAIGPLRSGTDPRRLRSEPYSQETLACVLSRCCILRRNKIPFNLGWAELKNFTSLLAVAGLIRSVLRALLARWRGRSLATGIYRTVWTDHFRGRMKCEVAILSRTWQGFRITPLNRHPALGRYSVRLSRYAQNGRVLLGGWQKPGYRGLTILTHHQHNAALLGQWLGPDREGNTRSGDWFFERVCQNSPSWSWHLSWQLKFQGILENYEKATHAGSVLPGVIKAHERAIREQSSVREIVFRGVPLKLNTGCFDPTQGHISIPLLDSVENQVQRDSLVLDLGTGSGFYAIYLAKTKGCRCVGVDVTAELVQLAQANAKRNNVEHLTSFHLCEPGDLYSWASFDSEFDFILANLPFSSVKNTWGSKQSPYHLAFRGSRRLLTQVVLHSLAHIRPTGKLAFAFGDSGYVKLLDTLLQVSPWTAEDVHLSKGDYDRTVVKHLRLEPFFRHINAMISQMTSLEAAELLSPWPVAKAFAARARTNEQPPQD
jgi:methylase of polypeptide subunit release factors